MTYKSPLYFVILLGLVSLFSDMTYEGARSITGPYLFYLGAGAAVVGFASGFGEFIGYGLRLFSGWLADKTKKYWGLMFIGYALNLLSVPALALVNSWGLAVLLIILERTGKALRTPARDTLLSYATFKMGRGLGFGIHEAMDQIGAFVGPLIVALVFYLKMGYKPAFLVLLIPALIALSLLTFARIIYPAPQKFEKGFLELETKGFSKSFWWYLLGMCLVGAGFVDFPLIGYHLEKTSILSKDWIPILYALAMGVDAFSAIFLGLLFDRIGLKAVILAIILSLGAIPLTFLGGIILIFLGMILWGIGLGAQESIMRAVIAQLVPIEKRGVGYGIFNTFFGLFWFVGSFLLGFLYDFSILALVAFSVTFQALSIPFILKVAKTA
ncbi:major facilitator superfamily MFS_1 [Thermodesulfobacterium geofontis OPF15]|uniref:Major facilitator superfamily MFS_1 n=1 Tax=Thermodesulfobacterium geofontis (strain OPF15) TaxID=795359 RepID=F8C513_THEGP|nr:MFS transporter [Thermodesulfobacterium geofontis]AEH22801.1 major facilitator superfamily MFS_1 [Thermodesulfobacterium geofontis OPF15]